MHYNPKYLKLICNHLFSESQVFLSVISIGKTLVVRIEDKLFDSEFIIPSLLDSTEIEIEPEEDKR